jgi:hypothetical protein
MGQAQNQLNLDDLFSSSKAVTGNFGRSRPQTSVLDESGSRKPSFSEVLLKNLEQKDNIQKPKVAHSDTETKTIQATNRESEPKTAAFSQKPEQTRQSGSAAKDTPNARTNSGPASAKDSSPVDDVSEKYQVHSENNAQSTDQSAARSDEQQSSPSTDQASPSGRENSSTNKVDPVLVPLQKQFGKKLTTDAVINNNAILSFITGRLDKLQPDTLPSLLSESALIKQVLGSDDVGKFLESPASINELANLLELDQKLLAGAARDGLNPSEFVKPKDFIKALGIDPNQVASELITLKQTLPTQGVEAYIDRAQALAALKQNRELAPQVATVTPKKLTSKNVGDGARPSIAPNINSEGSEDKIVSPEQSLAAAVAVNPFAQLKSNAAVDNSNKSSPSPQNVDQRVVRTDFIPKNILKSAPDVSLTNQNIAASQATDSPDMNILISDIVRPEVGIKLQPAETDESYLAQAFRAGVNPMAAGVNPMAAGVNPMAAGVNPMAAGVQASEGRAIPFMTSQSNDIVPTEDDEITLALSAASIDPFDAMSREIDTTTSTKIEFGGNGINHRTLEEMLIERNASPGMTTKRPDFEMNVQSTELVEKAPDSKRDTTDNRSFELGSVQETVDTSATLSDSGSIFTFNGSGQGFSEGSDSSSFQDNSENTPAAVIGEKSSSARESAVNFTSKLSTTGSEPARESLAQKILGQAEIMFKNGGGSMRMDVEAPGIGKVDVAINLNNNQLDVRIMTTSEQARDIISREVAGLRDGLSQQGLNLRGLEVGKAGESSSRQFAGQGNQHFGQGAPDQKATYNDMKEYVQSFRNSYAPRNTDRLVASSPTLGRWNNMAAGSGSRLEVRV